MGIESKLTQFPSPWLSQSTNLQAHQPQSLTKLVQNEPIQALGPETLLGQSSKRELVKIDPIPHTMQTGNVGKQMQNVAKQTGTFKMRNSGKIGLFS